MAVFLPTSASGTATNTATSVACGRPSLTSSRRSTWTKCAERGTACRSRLSKHRRRPPAGRHLSLHRHRLPRRSLL
eukprot:13166278-Heterocapsa_arctica.AAC.1